MDPDHGTEYQRPGEMPDDVAQAALSMAAAGAGHLRAVKIEMRKANPRWAPMWVVPKRSDSGDSQPELRIPKALLAIWADSRGRICPTPSRETPIQDRADASW